MRIERLNVRAGIGSTFMALAHIAADTRVG